MTDYQAIDCGLHGEYELAIMRKKTLNLSWQQPGQGLQTQAVNPLDLITRNHEEFLLVENAKGKSFEVRLDWIKST